MAALAVRTDPCVSMTEDIAGGTLDRDFRSVDALDAAFAGVHCEMVRADGTAKPLAADRWTGEATSVERALFVDPCIGSTLDIGCGPGRMTQALVDRGIDALGLDISGEAVRLTRQRGVPAVRHDIFDDLPGDTRWQHVLLADGNIGVGGNPERLLHRVTDLLMFRGSALVELAGPGVARSCEEMRLRVHQRCSEPFPWATVGIDHIDDIAHAAKLVVTDVRCIAGRHVATLVHRLTGVDTR